MDIVPEQKWCTSTFHCAYKQVRPLCLSLVAVGFRVGVLFVDHKGLTSESHGKAWLGFTIQRVLSGLHSGHPRHSHAMLSKIRGEVVPRMQPKVLRIRGYRPNCWGWYTVIHCIQPGIPAGCDSLCAVGERGTIAPKRWRVWGMARVTG